MSAGEPGIRLPWQFTRRFTMALMKNPTRRSFLLALSAVPLASKLTWASAAPPSLLFAGTYTSHKGSTSKGIYSFRWDASSGTLSPLGLAVEAEDPAFLAFSPDRRRLYAANEISQFNGEKTGSVSSFSVDPLSGKLTLKNVVSSGGTGPANVSVDHTGRVVFASDYSGGSLSSYRVLPDGRLSEPVSNFHFSGHGVKPRQDASHIHCATPSPENRYVLVNDLGLDRILIYRFNVDTAVLTPNDPPYYAAIAGSGPRALAFHPNSRWAYSINELGNTIDALAWNAKAGTLTRFQNVSTLPPGFTGFSTAATVVIDTAGRFLYASNRYTDTIAVFSINAESGRLTMLQQIAAGGKLPRHFTLDPTNRWLLVANQDSSNIVVLKRNPQTGFLTSLNREISVGSPVCLVFG
jgi:6-phosphogluconolactonase